MRKFTEPALTDEIERCADDLDGMEPIDTLINIADHLDVDLARCCAKIKYGRRRNADEQLISILIESSQSDLNRSLRMIQRAVFADRMIGEL